MNYEELKNAKYLLTLKINDNEKIIDCLTGETLYSHGKNYILVVNNGTYSVWDDFHDEEQISYNFPALEWFNVSKLN